MANIETFGWISLTEAVNKIQTPKSFILDTVFRPKERQHLTNKIQIAVKVGNKKLAPFVQRSSPAAVVEKLNAQAQFVELPRIRLKKPFTGSELLFQQDGSLPVYVGGAGDISSFREKKIGEELQDLKDRITRRTEWMAAKALQGAITVSQDGLSLSYDFLMPTANKPALTGTAKWDDAANCDPIANIRAWQVVSQNASGKIPTMAIARTETINKLLASTKAKDYLNNRRMVVGDINTNKVANEFGVKFIGNIEGVDIYEYNESYTDESGNTQPMVPANAFLMVSPNAENRLHYGAIEDLEAGQNIAMPFFAKDWIEKDPSVYWLLVESSPLPVPHEPEALIFATVY